MLDNYWHANQEQEFTGTFCWLEIAYPNQNPDCVFKQKLFFLFGLKQRGAAVAVTISSCVACVADLV